MSLLGLIGFFSSHLDLSGCVDGTYTLHAGFAKVTISLGTGRVSVDASGDAGGEGSSGIPTKIALIRDNKLGLVCSGSSVTLRAGDAVVDPGDPVELKLLR